MISVIVPVYNVEKYIARCIESVIAQEYTDWELILVDDGSPDRSGEICDEYAKRDNRIRVIHQKNQGVSAARNRGIAEVQGEYLCFIDSDDYVSPRYLCDFSRDNDVDIEIQGMTLLYEGESQRNHTKKPQTNQKLDLVSLLKSDASVLNLLSGPCCKLFKRDIVVENHLSFPVGLSYGEDSIFVLSYLLHIDAFVHFIPSSNYYYNHFNQENSLSSKRHDGMKLYCSTFEDYKIFTKLQEKYQTLPSTYIEYYRNYNASVYYNAVLNVLISSSSFSEKHRFLGDRSKSMVSFFRQARQLPVTYYTIKVLDAILPNSMLAFFFPLVYRLIR